MPKTSGFIPYIVPEELRSTRLSIGGERQQQMAEALMKRGPKQRPSDMLANIGRELICVGRTAEVMTKLERVLRIVWDMSESGDQWAIGFLVDRLEGRPTQKIQVHNTEGDIRDLSTAELMALASDDAQIGPQMTEAFEVEVQARVRQVLAAMGNVAELPAPVVPSVAVVVESAKPVKTANKRAGRKRRSESS